MDGNGNGAAGELNLADLTAEDWHEVLVHYAVALGEHLRGPGGVEAAAEPSAAGRLVYRGIILGLALARVFPELVAPMLAHAGGERDADLNALGEVWQRHVRRFVRQVQPQVRAERLGAAARRRTPR